jgi:NAD-dependent SIR2 family protein deacetylase
MKISRIDLPNPLLKALQNHQLVVFAGAGVSIPQPAGLPTFRQLAEAVATGTVEGLQEGESEDHFLGRLHYKGQQIHLQAAQELQKTPQNQLPFITT